jgi:hypothetical protein
LCYCHRRHCCCPTMNIDSDDNDGTPGNYSSDDEIDDDVDDCPPLANIWECPMVLQEGTNCLLLVSCGRTQTSKRYRWMCIVRTFGSCLMHYMLGAQRESFGAGVRVGRNPPAALDHTDV